VRRVENELFSRKNEVRALCAFWKPGVAQYSSVVE